MGVSRGNGWFWSASQTYNDDLATQKTWATILATYEFSLLAPEEKKQIDIIVIPDTAILPIFRNRWRLDDKIEECERTFNILNCVPYITYLKTTEAEAEKKQWIERLTFTIFLLKARIKLDILETQHQSMGFGWGRQAELKQRVCDLDHYISLYNTLSAAEAAVANPYAQYKTNAPWSAFTPAICEFNGERLRTLWERTCQNAVLMAEHLANVDGNPALNTIGIYAGYASFYTYDIRLLLKILDVGSLIVGCQELRDNVFLAERMSYYFDSYKDMIINDLFWAPGNYITCGALNLVSNANAFYITEALLLVDALMCLNSLREVNADYAQEKARLVTLPESTLQKAALRALDLKYNHKYNDAVFNGIYASLLIIALLILCSSFYFAVPAATADILSLTCSLICYSAGFIRETALYNMLVWNQEALSSNVREDLTGRAIHHAYSEDEIAVQTKYHQQMIAYQTTTFQCKMVRLILTSVASLLVLSLSTWPVWPVIGALTAIYVAVRLIEYAYLNLFLKLEPPKMSSEYTSELSNASKPAI